MRVYKYPLADGGGPVLVRMPKGAKIVAVRLQNNVPTLWAEVDPAANMTVRKFQVFPTGANVPDAATYLGTFEADGWFIGHVYEL